MTNHPETEALQAYIDGELPSDEMSQLEAHLQSCSACESEVAELRELFATIESVPSEPMRIDLAPKVLDSIRPKLPSLAIGEFLLAAALTAAMVIWFGGTELQGRVGGALQRLAIEIEGFSATALSAINEFAVQVPVTPRFDQIGDSLGSAFLSPTLLWSVAAAALVLWLLGNGLVLRMGKDNNA